MKLSRTFFSPLAVLLLLASCSQEEVLQGTAPEEIRLSGDIAGLTASSTRAAIHADYAQTLNVCFARIDQNTSDGNWPADYSAVVSPLAATRAGGSEQQNIQFTTSQFYQTPEENNGTKLIGWYPAGTYDAGTVTFTLDGSTDVMLTQEVEGNKKNGSKFGEAGHTFTFNHLLTQVTVKAFASVDGTASKWGKVTSIKVKQVPTECTVTLPDQAPTWGGALQDLLLKNPADDAAMSSIDLNGKTQAAPAVCGYALFKPTQGADLTLEVITELGDKRDITVTLPGDADPRFFAAGKSYTVTLEFKSTTVAPSATISDWIPAGSNPSADL